MRVPVSASVIVSAEGHTAALQPAKDPVHAAQHTRRILGPDIRDPRGLALAVRCLLLCAVRLCGDTAQHSRHKSRYTPPSTPDGFWGLTLETPEDWH
jgi:hypothetical protein